MNAPPMARKTRKPIGLFLSSVVNSIMRPIAIRIPARRSRRCSESVICSSLRAPEPGLAKFGGVVNLIVTTGGEARHLVGLDSLHDFRIGIVGCAFFETARTKVAVQALAVVIRMIKMQGWLGLAEVLHINVVQAAQL